MRNLTVAAFVCLAITGHAVTGQAIAADTTGGRPKTDPNTGPGPGPRAQAVRQGSQAAGPVFLRYRAQPAIAGASGESVGGRGPLATPDRHRAELPIRRQQGHRHRAPWRRLGSTGAGAKAAESSGQDRKGDGGKVTRSFWDRFHLAQADSRQAQSDSSASNGASRGRPGSEEIVVTAEKRKERLLEAPVAVTALSGQTLSDTHAYDMTNLTNLTPSLTFTAGQHRQQQQLSDTRRRDPGLRRRNRAGCVRGHRRRGARASSTGVLRSRRHRPGGSTTRPPRHPLRQERDRRSHQRDDQGSLEAVRGQRGRDGGRAR